MLDHIKSLSVEKLSEILSKHISNQSFFRENQFFTCANKTIENNFYGKNLRRIYYDNCTFDKAILFRAGFSGSYFVNCRFIDVNFRCANLNQCTFKNCSFDGSIKGANFDSSEFFNCRFNACKIEDTLFSNAYFDSCCFDNGKWLAVFLENATFIHSKLNFLTFNKLNFEFVYIDDTSLDNCCLPFQALPYMIGGFDYLKKENDLIYFKSRARKTRKLNKYEYMEMIPYLEEFYKKTNNHFPLANIYIYYEQFEKAYEAILSGINYSLSIQQFRLIQHYCELFLKTNGFSSKQRAQMSKNILLLISPHIKESIGQKNNKYLLSVRNKLTYYSEEACSIVSIKTNIPEGNTDAVNSIIKAFEPLFFKKDIRYHYEIRHNSPYEIGILLLDNLPNILTIVASITTIAATVATYLKHKEKKEKQKMDKNEPTTMEQNVINDIIQVVNINNIEIHIDVTNFHE